MDFEEKLQQVSEIRLQKEELIDKKDSLVVNTKIIIESEFKTIKKYYPRTSFKIAPAISNEKNHNISDFLNCCFLLFDKDERYYIQRPTAIGFKIQVDDSGIIKITHSILKVPQRYNKLYNYLVNDLNNKLFKNQVYYSSEFNKNSIKEATQDVLIESINMIKSVF